MTPPTQTTESEDYVLRVQRRGLQKLSYWLNTVPGRLFLVALAAAVVMVWQAPTIYRAAKVWRVKQLIANCKQAQSVGDETTEVRLLQEAFNLLPTHPLTVRARAHLLERRGEAAALVVYQQLLGDKEATKDDAIRACRLAAMRGSLEACEKILKLAERITSDNEPAAVLALRARTKAGTDPWSAAVALAQKAVEQSDSQAPEKLLLATILLQTADRASDTERVPMAERAVVLLSELATNADDTGLSALNALLSLARMPAAAKLLARYDVNAWVAAAESNPKASPKLRVLAWTLHRLSKHQNLDQFLASFSEKWREAPLPERLEAARWLNQNGHPRLCLGLTFPEKETSEDWFLVHLDALAGARQWTALLEHLDATSGQATTMSGALRTLFRLIAQAEKGEPIDVEASWREIQIQLQSDPVPTQLFIAQYAEKTGEFKQAAITYQRILDLSSTASLAHNLSREAKLACYTGLMRSLPASTPIGQVLPIAESLATEFPEFEEARNEALYLGVLAGKLDDHARAAINSLQQKAPSNPALRATAALIELQSGNVPAANKLCEDLPINWDAASDRFKVVRAAVLAASNRPEEAQQLRAKIRERDLRPEEVALLP